MQLNIHNPFQQVRLHSRLPFILLLKILPVKRLIQGCQTNFRILNLKNRNPRLRNLGDVKSSNMSIFHSKYLKAVISHSYNNKLFLAISNFLFLSQSVSEINEALKQAGDHFPSISILISIIRSALGKAQDVSGSGQPTSDPQPGWSWGQYGHLFPNI